MALRKFDCLKCQENCDTRKKKPDEAGLCKKQGCIVRRGSDPKPAWRDK